MPTTPATGREKRNGRALGTEDKGAKCANLIRLGLPHVSFPIRKNSLDRLAESVLHAVTLLSLVKVRRASTQIDDRVPIPTPPRIFF